MSDDAKQLLYDITESASSPYGIIESTAMIIQNRKRNLGWQRVVTLEDGSQFRITVEALSE